MEGELYLHMLPITERQAHILQNINHSLFSIVSLCDMGCIVKFRIKYITVMYKNDSILRGWRNHHNKLWYLTLSIDNKYEKVGDKKIIWRKIFMIRKPKHS